MEKTREPVSVQWAELGEGLEGDFNEEDAEDIELLRFDVYVRQADGSWADVEDGSFCTGMPVAAPEVIREVALECLLDRVYREVRERGSCRRGCEEMSWLSPDHEEVVRRTRERIGPAAVPEMLRCLRDLHPEHGVRFAANWIRLLPSEEARLLTPSDVRPLLEARSRPLRELVVESILLQRPDLLEKDDLRILLESSAPELRTQAIAALHRFSEPQQTQLRRSVG